jgi:hypothetical protein
MFFSLLEGSAAKRSLTHTKVEALTVSNLENINGRKERILEKL